MKSMKKIFLACLTGAGASLIGCAPANNPSLTRAEGKFQTVREEGVVAANAPAAWREAEEELADAQAAWRNKESDPEVDHLSYLAGQKLGIAYFKAAAELERSQRSSTALISRDTEQARARLRSEYLDDRAIRLKRELAEFKPQWTDRGLEITLGQAVFESDTAALKPDAYLRLKPLAQYLRDEPLRSVIIEGHTDSAGSPDYNAQLSLDRANAVGAVLVLEGIDYSRITTSGLGESFPVASNDTAAGRLQNRRVEVIIR